MTNNDIFRRLRFCFNLNDHQVRDVFALADVGVTEQQISHWLKKEDDVQQVNMPDAKLAAFLNGFITYKRGPKDGDKPAIEKKLNNNLIFTKLKIALNYKAEDIIALLSSVDFRLGKAELSAFFRKPDHKHFRECKDQVLRNFLTALQKQERPTVNNAHSTSVNKVQPQKSHAKKSATQKSSKKDKKIYHNPNAAKQDSSRNVLKLKPEQIWGKKTED
ncbi:DUF1456 family protein [Thalassotalea euphylliae]|uniref:DUF1456 family protein n=1 Tax=Thalassotalea euphylliae TaxID=1655234 RepID=UPI003635999D